MLSRAGRHTLPAVWYICTGRYQDLQKKLAELEAQFLANPQFSSNGMSRTFNCYDSHSLNVHNGCGVIFFSALTLLVGWQEGHKAGATCHRDSAAIREPSGNWLAQFI